jgi:hypothetical protein
VDELGYLSFSKIGDATLARSGETTVPIEVEVDSATGIAGLFVQLNYDPYVAEPFDIRTTETTADFSLIDRDIDDATRQAGTLRFLASTSRNLEPGTSTWLNVAFRGIGTAANGLESPLHGVRTKLARQYGEDIRWFSIVDLEDGSLTFSCHPLDVDCDGVLGHEDLFQHCLDWKGSFEPSNLVEFIERTLESR